MSSQTATLGDVEQHLNTTISSPTRGWYEVYQNTDPDEEGDIHLVPVEYFGTERFISADDLRQKMADGWTTVYDGTTRDTTEGPQ